MKSSQGKGLFSLSDQDLQKDAAKPPLLVGGLFALRVAPCYLPRQIAHCDVSVKASEQGLPADGAAGKKECLPPNSAMKM